MVGEMEEESKLKNELNLCMVRGEGLRKELDEVYGYASKRVGERIRELDFKEVELKDKSFALEERAKKVEEAEGRLVDLEVEVEAKRKELNFIKNQVEIFLAESNAEEMRLSELRRLVEECAAEKILKERELSEMVETLRQTQVEIDSKDEELGQMETELERYHAQVSAEMESLRKLDEESERKLKDLTLVQDKIGECEKMFETLSSELVSKEEELEVISQKIDLREQTVMSVNSDMKEACQRMETKDKELKDVQKLIKERKAHCESLEVLIQERNEELASKVKQRDEITEAIRNSNEELDSVKEKIEDGLKDFQFKEEEQARVRASLMEREQRLELKEKELGAREEMINKKDQELKLAKSVSSRKELSKSSKKTQMKAKDLCSFCQQQLNSDQHVDLVRDARVFDEKTLQLLLRGHLKKLDQLHIDVLSSLRRSYDPAKLVLDTVIGLYSAHLRTAVQNLDPKSVQRSSIFLLECLMDMSPKPTTEVQAEAIRFATEWKNTSLVKAENPIEVLEFLHFLAAFSLAYTSDTNQVQSLFDVAFLRKYGPSLCKALGLSALAPPVINCSDPCSSDVQQSISIASSHLPNEDSLRDFEGSTSFPSNEDPGRFVVTSVEDALMNAHQRGVSSLEERTLMTLVPLLEELGRVGISTDPDLQSDATRVAHQWGGMMGAGVKKSQLEVWAFLQFIVAFGLVLKQTQQDETLQFASHVAHFRHAPKLFESLGLAHAIPDFVKELLKKGLYIPAIRFMFYFNVENNFSPLELLKEQIINLRRSAKENTRYESQAEATLREMMELIEDLKLEIDIPADLILKFIVPTSSVPVQSTRMQASDTVIQSSCIATHGSNPSLPTSFGPEPYQAGTSSAALLPGQQHSHHVGSKRPSVLDPEGTRPVIRPCFSPPPGSSRF
ncbi:uncharacterized protein LOC108828112 [Raphanus sativus]|uniref:FRIGIDA-like protein n=1 Tax=Raphanus sativus TaxID=3726 RepID=A0A6J0LAG9_RAPSA|nr:uncharacterized protein LOC108828112 [Raphanus sativus]